MQFSIAQQEVAARIGRSTTNTDLATLIKRWLNFSYKDIASAYDWSWLRSTERKTLEIDLTTGTVSVSAGSSTITFSAAPAASQTNRFIQFSSSDEWYKITAHTAGQPTATIDPAYRQTSNLSAGTFTVRTFYYSLSSSVAYISSIKLGDTKRYIYALSTDKIDREAPFYSDTGPTGHIYNWGYDSNGYLMFSPYPWPDSAYILYFNIIKAVTELSSDTDTPIFPSRFDSAWIDRAVSYGYEYMNDSRYKDIWQRSQTRIDGLMTKDNPTLYKRQIIDAVDGGETTNFDHLQYPQEITE